MKGASQAGRLLGFWKSVTKLSPDVGRKNDVHILLRVTLCTIHNLSLDFFVLFFASVF